MLTLLIALVSPALALAPRRPLPPLGLQAIALPDTPIAAHRLTVKLRDPVLGRAKADGGLHSEAGADLGALLALASAHGVRFRPLIDLDPQLLTGLEARAAARTGRAQADLQGMLVVDGLRDGQRMVELGQQLQQLDVVEYAFVGVVGTPPPGDSGTETPDYADRQTYLDADPGVGAWQAWGEGITGSFVRISDIEYGWEATHEDLVGRDLGLESGQSIPDWVGEYAWDQHGTAVMGMLAGVDNGFGVTGGAFDATIGTFPEYSDEEGSRRAAAIASAAAASVPGDVILLEMQTYTRGDYLYGPAELDPDVFTVVQTAVDAGIVVVGAAGNGAENLDSAFYADSYLVWGDSGAILVGAGTPDARHETYYFSTHGDRVDLQGWGGNVVTLGYGDLIRLDGDDDRQYTAAFSGTSSASPIVAVAAALVQDYAVGALGGALDPLVLRELLIETGTAQGSGGHIGPLPDIMAAIDALDLDRDGLTATRWGGEDHDADGDGHDSLDWGGDDCDDDDPSTSPSAEELPDDGVDNDCDDEIDEGSGGTDSGGSDGGGTDGGGSDGGGSDGGGSDGGGSDGGGSDGGGSDGGDTDGGVDDDGKGSCSACSAASATTAWPLLLGLGALLGRRRRRA